MNFLVDLHVHTSQISACGKVPAEEIVSLYKQAGVSGIAITDHYTKSYFESIESASWIEKVDTFLGGYQSAKAAGDKCDLRVYFGIEFRNLESNNDFLVYGLNRNFLIANPDIFEIPLEEAIVRFHSVNALVIQAHPCRMRLTIPIGEILFDDFPQDVALSQIKTVPKTPVMPWKNRKLLLSGSQNLTFLKVCNLLLPNLIDGIEVYNGNESWFQNPEEINNILVQWPNLIPISASDFHNPSHLAQGGLLLNSLPKNDIELVNMLRSNAVVGYHAKKDMLPNSLRNFSYL